MNVIISAKDFKLTDTLKAYVIKHTAKLSHFSKSIQEIKVELDADKNQTTGVRFRAEASALVNGRYFKAGERAEHIQEAIDLCMPKLVRQVERYKEKLQSQRKRSPRASFL